MAALAAGETDAATMDVVWITGVLIAVVLVAGVVIFLIRRMAVDRSGASGAGLSIEEIDRLHQDGLLSVEEYDRARRAALGLPPPLSASAKKRASQAATGEGPGAPAADGDKADAEQSDAPDPKDG